jgi:UrcA family protein
MSKTVLILAAVVTAFGSAAIAQPTQQARSIHVSFADLDLTQNAGRATLEARVRVAVSRVCRLPSGTDLDAMNRYRACRKAAWSGVRPQLAAAYDGARYASQARTVIAAQAR